MKDSIRRYRFRWFLVISSVMGVWQIPAACAPGLDERFFSWVDSVEGRGDQRVIAPQITLVTTNGVEDCVIVEASILIKVPTRIFNPTFDRMREPPIGVLVFDKDHNFLCDILKASTISQNVAGEGNYFFGEAGSRVGRQFVLDITDVRKHLKKDYLDCIYLQMVCYKGLLSFDKVASNTSDGKDFVNFYSTFDRSELARSNVVSLDMSKRR